MRPPSQIMVCWERRAFAAPTRAGRRLPLRGFTLIELVISISVGAIISGIAGSLIWNAARQRTEVAARGELVDMGSAALEVMLRYIREIPQNECPGNPTPCLGGRAQISLASATELRFGSNGLRYNAGSRCVEITNNNGTNWWVVASDVGSCAFSYFSRTNAALTAFPLSQDNREGVRRISIDLQFARGTESAHLRTSIYLRNFMNEVMTSAGS
jgi:prepilin-type N-terminal cleavage/methylation domain-containing protein